MSLFLAVKPIGDELIVAIGWTLKLVISTVHYGSYFFGWPF